MPPNKRLRAKKILLTGQTKQLRDLVYLSLAAVDNYAANADGQLCTEGFPDQPDWAAVRLECEYIMLNIWFIASRSRGGPWCGPCPGIGDSALSSLLPARLPSLSGTWLVLRGTTESHLLITLWPGWLHQRQSHWVLGLLSVESR